jgi:hypothetical protein
MQIRTFREFLGGKRREAKRQLHMVQEALKKGGFKIEDFLDERFDDPYIYCYNPNKDTSFKGVRIYKVGDKIAYRVQRESKTHPFGTAYMLDMDAIFNDMMADGMTKKEQLGHKLMEEIIHNIRAFFKESADAERSEDKWDDDGDSMGMVHVRNPLGGDYSSQVHDGNNTGSSGGR